MSEVVIVEKNLLKPKQRKTLEENGYIVLVVDNINGIKMLPASKIPEIEDDGFNLDA